MKRVFVIFFLLFFSACESTKALSSLKLISTDSSKIINLNVEIVDNESTRQVGLMYRKEMPENQGMLFIFPDEVPRSFWMKNTYLELDMFFFDTNKKLVSIVKRATPLTETRRDSNLPAKYCLEVLGGSADKWAIEPGSQFELSQ